MNLENLAQILIYIHAACGGLALLAGTLALIVKKGSPNHKNSGKLFFYAMLVSASMALFIAILPNHRSPFLFAIGVFSAYFILMGYRALKYKRKNISLKVDKGIAWVMVITGVTMVLASFMLYDGLNIVLLAFGVVGLIFSILDISQFRNPEKLKAQWLKKHLGKMIGGYISAMTAFVVVNEFFSSAYGWFIPSILGGIIIVYWFRKLNGKAPKKI